MVRGIGCGTLRFYSMSRGRFNHSAVLLICSIKANSIPNFGSGGFCYLIPEIIIDPKNSTPNAVVEVFLNTNGYVNAKVRRSRST
jgi:hypothetical protein